MQYILRCLEKPHLHIKVLEVFHDYIHSTISNLKAPWKLQDLLVQLVVLLNFTSTISEASQKVPTSASTSGRVFNTCKHYI